MTTATEAKGDSSPETLRRDDAEGSDSDGNTSFLRAARDGNLSEVLEYLKGSTDINTSNANGLNALHLASKEGHLNIVTELLKRGANVEAATKKGNTALHIASLAGHEEIVKLLVENGAKVNVQAQAGFTPLYMAAQEGHAEVVKFLLASGASQSLATGDGYTPLAVALQQGHERVVTVLLEYDTKGKVRLPALHIAAKKDDIKSAALLLQNEQNNVDAQTKSGFTPLHIASHYGNVNVGTLLIQRGADVNFKAKNNITPLHVSSRWGKPSMISLLLTNGASIDEKTRDGLTPLHCAARSGHENVVDLLLERGAPYSSKTKNGLTPLHMAAQGDHVDCARLLLYHKAPVDDVTVDYLTPLHVAGHCGNVKTAKLLLDRKCDSNARALNGFTPLHIACKKNRIKVVELLLKYGASIEATTESGLTPLHVASFMGHMNIVIYLIQHNANPDYPTVRGETALHLAARANQTDIIRILLRNSTSVDARAREQQTPLHIAARLGNVDNVMLLLQHDASPDSTTKDLYTPLHIAAKEGHEEVASVLLEHMASHGLTTKKGFTPLHIAAKYGNIKVARLLLQKEANPDVQGKNGLTPLHVATHYNHVNVALLLLSSKASPHSTAKNGYTPLHIAAKKNQMDIATSLLEYGAKPDSESKNGFTPLHLAAQEGHTDMVSLLLEHKATVNVKAQNGLTPMHLAAQEDRVNVGEILVKYEAEKDPQTKAGYTPLHTACHFGQANMVRFLLGQDSSVSATTKLGYTPLHQAAQQGHVQVVNLLLKNNASPNAVTNNGQTPLAIAQKLGYISVVDVLMPVTEVTDTVPASEDKYKVVSPETMQETLLSDSEDEGGDDSLSLEKGGMHSPLDTSYEKDILRYPDSVDTSRHAERITSEITTAMRYPSYLEHGPDYEAEMKYFSGHDTLSPKDKDGKGGRLDSSVFADYSTLERLDTPEKQVELHLRSADENTSELDYEDDMRYLTDDSAMKKDFMEAAMVSSALYSEAPDNRYATGKTESSRYSSYSGSNFSTTFDPDNVAIDRTPVYSGFLISFMVDARGGAMRGCRHSGVRIVIPPRKASMPTRVTCRLIKKEKLMVPPPLNEGEALACRILEMGPVGTTFLGPVIIEVPHFASLRGKEREIVIMRSDDGDHWYEHPMMATEEAVTAALGGSIEGPDGSNASFSMSSLSSLWKLEGDEELAAKRIARILTTDFPQYFAVVSRVHTDQQNIGGEGGVISSTVVPQVQAVFPEGSLTKPIRVGLQVQPIAPETVAKFLGNRVAVSPIVTVEPRRRKFHKLITLTIPVPKAAQKGMINQYSGGGDAPSLRLLCSIAEGTKRYEGSTSLANWEDITQSKPLTFVDDCVSFTTTVSARFWLMDCQNVGDAAKMATELYNEAICVPFMAKFAVFAKRHSEEEGKLRMFCMTDDKIDKTLERQEHFVEVARSRDVEVLQGRPQFIEMAGNLIPVTKSGDQLCINFKAFRENRLPCTVRIRDLDQEPTARVAFMKDPKVARGEVPQTPICNLNITLPDMSKSSSMEMEGDAALELRKRHSLLREHGIIVQDTVSSAQMKLTDVADTLKGDWVMLAQQLDVTTSEINKIKNDYNTVNDQALAMLQLWVEKNGEKASGNALEKALIQINRKDVVQKCMYNIETVEDELEAAAARVAMDQSGFDTFREEVGISKDSSMKREMSLEVEYDEKEIMKESESATEESSPTSEGGGSVVEKSAPAPQAIEEGDDQIVPTFDQRKGIAKAEPLEDSNRDTSSARKQAYIDLISEMDRLSDEKESRAGGAEKQETEDQLSVGEEELVREEKTKTEELMMKMESLLEQGEPSQKQREERVTHQADVDQLAARLRAAEAEQEPEEGETVFDSQMPSGETYYEEVLPDGTVVRHRRLGYLPKQHVHFEDSAGLELIEASGPPKDVTDEEDYEEVLENGTVHKVHITRHHSIQHVKTSLHSESGDEELFEGDVDVPGTTKQELLETFEEPPHSTVIVEDEDIVLPDGTHTTRHVVMNRQVHSIKTHHESFDQSTEEKEEDDFEIEEVIPGTESAFCTVVSSSESDDEELEGDFTADIGQVEKILRDGTVITSTVTATHEKRIMRSREGSVSEADELRVMSEETVAPSSSPRSGSPATAKQADKALIGRSKDDADYVKTVIRAGHLEEMHKGDTVETTWETVEDELTPKPSLEQANDDVDEHEETSGAMMMQPPAAEGGEVQSKAPQRRIASIDDDDFTECDINEHMDILAHGIPDQLGDDEDEEEEDLPEGAAGGEPQSTRVMMKKQIHKKTVIKDGQEQTFIHEEARVQQDSEAPEELRDSMQQIIDQFMDTQPTLEHQQILEDDV